ncbi:MAG: meiotic recombination [Bathelium mastoideum]|nr:MAG: meiotic recombination [Bathelium mastoideum]
MSGRNNPNHMTLWLRYLRREDNNLSIINWLIQELESEHVLRSSSSFTSRNSLRQENTRTEAPHISRIQNGRLGTAKYSPTPSIKRGKAERLLKEHGSPPGLRVTAGGKIVPSDITPLCSPRFGFNQPNRQGFLNVAPFEGQSFIPAPMIPARPQPINGTAPLGPFVGFTSDGQYVPLMPVPYGGFANYVNNDQIAQMPATWNPGPGAPIATTQQQPMAAAPVQGIAGNSMTLTTGQQIQVLEREQTKLNDEYRHVDQAGVIHQGALSATQRAALVSRKVSLTNRLDEIRRSLKKIKESEESKSSTPPEKVQPNMGHPLAKAPRPPYPGPQQMPFFSQPMQATGPFGNLQYLQAPPAYPMPQAQAQPHLELADPSSASFLVPNGPSNHFRQFSASTPGLTGEATAAPSAATSASIDGSSLAEQGGGQASMSRQASHGPRRSHAVAIKNPQQTIQQGGIHSQKSSLDPTSPSYKPMSVSEDSRHATPFIVRGSEPSPCPKEALGKDYEWQSGVKDSMSPEDSSVSKKGDLQHKISLSSVSTADFFPINPLEHSTKNMRSREKSDSGLLAPPVTPNRPSPAPLTRHVDRRSSEAPASPVPNNFRMSSWNAACDPIPDRTENNMSPKARFPSATSDPGKVGDASSRRAFDVIPTIRAVASEDAGESKPRGFTDRYCEGYHAGLHRLPLDKDEYGDALEGYIAGLQHFADLQTSSQAGRGQSAEEIVEDTKDDALPDNSSLGRVVELKENAMSSHSTQSKAEVEQAATRPPSVQFGAPLTRQFSGNQIQSLERYDKADKPTSAMAPIPARITSIGHGMMSPGGSLGENRSRNISLPVNRRGQSAAFNWSHGLPQHDGPSDRAVSSAPMDEAMNQNVALTQLPAEPIRYESERAPTPPPKHYESPTKPSAWQAKSPKSSPSKAARSPAKSRLDRLATHLGVKKSEPIVAEPEDANPGSPESTTPERKKRREELKKFLSRPKGEQQAHELKPFEKGGHHDA